MESPTAGQPIVISAIAPMHGPAVRYSVVELLRKYRRELHQTASATKPCGNALGTIFTPNSC